MNSFFRVLFDEEMSAVADWLIKNAPQMNESIFSGRSWDLLEAEEILVLRAFAPSGIFVSANKSKYLSLVQKRDLINLADCLFQNDQDFIINLPHEFNSYLPQIKTMMEFAYQAKIRKK